MDEDSKTVENSQTTVTRAIIKHQNGTYKRNEVKKVSFIDNVKNVPIYQLHKYEKVPDNKEEEKEEKYNNDEKYENDEIDEKKIESSCVCIIY